MGEYRRLATIGRSFGIDGSLLTPEETKNLFPFINEKIIEGGLYIPGCGIVDPKALSEALIRSAQAHGAKVRVLCNSLI